jgi:hypothetical protein
MQNCAHWQSGRVPSKIANPSNQSICIFQIQFLHIPASQLTLIFESSSLVHILTNESTHTSCCTIPSLIGEVKTHQLFGIGKKGWYGARGQFYPHTYIVYEAMLWQHISSDNDKEPIHHWHFFHYVRIEVNTFCSTFFTVVPLSDVQQTYTLSCKCTTRVVCCILLLCHTYIQLMSQQLPLHVGASIGSQTPAPHTSPWIFTLGIWFQTLTWQQQRMCNNACSLSWTTTGWSLQLLVEDVIVMDGGCPIGSVRCHQLFWEALAYCARCSTSVP